MPAVAGSSLSVLPAVACPSLHARLPALRRSHIELASCCSAALRCLRLVPTTCPMALRCWFRSTRR
eukprot:4819959-Prymnesium_polylepis.1